MSVSYRAVGWNDFKKRYDRLLALGIVLFLVVFVVVGLSVWPAETAEILVLRGVATAAFFLLHVILAIGPLARLSPVWLPLLYNRRHLGVSMFLLAFIHALLAVLIYHGGSPANPIVSIFTTDAGWRMTALPFQAFGFVALMILFVMAATSHDFWLANLTAPVWKTLHMSVYIAYLLLVAHVAFGVLQSETSWVYAGLMGAGATALGALHIVAGFRPMENPRPRRRSADGFVPVCSLGDLEEDVPYGATLAGERIAILRYDGDKVSCVSGVCQHQNGPLAEGRYVDGCLTCPWHGYQYRPEDGQSPPPFTEKIPTFEVKLEGERVWVRSRANAPGTRVEPARVPAGPPPETS